MHTPQVRTFDRGVCRAEISGAGDQIQTAGLLVVELQFRYEQPRELLTDAVSEVRVGQQVCADVLLLRAQLIYMHRHMC